MNIIIEFIKYFKVRKNHFIFEILTNSRKLTRFCQQSVMPESSSRINMILEEIDRDDALKFILDDNKVIGFPSLKEVPDDNEIITPIASWRTHYNSWKLLKKNMTHGFLI